MRGHLRKSIAAVISLIALSQGAIRSQEVVISDFPIGVGGDVSASFFEPYYSQLQAVADTLQKYPMALAIVTGGADGTRYLRDNDAKNPGLALGRAHALRNVLLDKFDVDPGQLVIQSRESGSEGGPFRYASVRISMGLNEIGARLDSLALRPPVEKQVTEIREVSTSTVESMGLRFGVGLSSTPFGGLPIVTGAVTWKRIIFVEGLVGHTFWNGSFVFDNSDLDTWRRMAGGQVIVYPLSKIPVGAVGGWLRIEEISQRYYRYVKMSEGPVIGLRVTPLKFLSITGVYNPAKHNLTGDIISKSRNGQILISATVHLTFGGRR
jgi:hypothetical protein